MALKKIAKKLAAKSSKAKKPAPKAPAKTNNKPVAKKAAAKKKPAKKQSAAQVAAVKKAKQREIAARKKAADLKKKIAAGAKFADLAKAESDDVASGADGGNLGAFERGAMIPEFEDAAFSLPIGQVSDPVKSAFGYHLILVDKRGAKSLEEMRAEIQQRIAPEASDKGLEELKKKTTVTLNDQYFSK